MLSRSVLIIACLICVAGVLSSADAQHPTRDAISWSVKGKLIGKNGKKSRDVSGIACSRVQEFPKECIVVDDNLQSVQEVTLSERRITTGMSIPVVSSSFDGEPLELDGEGVAYWDSAFYIIGSHGHPRDRRHELDAVRDHDLIAARIDAASRIVRLKVGENGASNTVFLSDKLRAIIKAQPTLEPFTDRRLDENGLTIEGIAVLAGRMFVGFRSPGLPGGRAPVLSVRLDGLFADRASDARLVLLPLGSGNGVRDLAVEGGTILILSGPIADEAGAYAILAWDGRSESVRTLANIGTDVTDDGRRKPEAVLPLGTDGAGLHVLVLSDNGEEGAPTEITIAPP